MSPAARHDGGSQRLSGRGRVLAALAVVGLHAGVAAALLSVRTEPSMAAPQLLQLLEVQLLAEAARPPITSTPPPAAPKPARLLATAKPSLSPVVPPAGIEPPIEMPIEAMVEAKFEATGTAIVETATAPTAVATATEAPPIVPPSFLAAYLNNPAPGYPQAAKQRGESGQVLLRVRVGLDGHAGDVRIERSSGSSSLDAAARDVVLRKWRFVPAKRGEEAIEAWVLVPIVFALKA